MDELRRHALDLVHLDPFHGHRPARLLHPRALAAAQDLTEEQGGEALRRYRRHRHSDYT